MTKEEFSRLGMAIKEFYPAQKVLRSEQAIMLWYQQLKDLDYKTASYALSKYVATNKFPPTVADIREQYMMLVNGEAPLWSDGWEEVIRAIRNYGYMRKVEALDSMSDLTRETVKRLGWESLCLSENPSVDRGNFRMIYGELAERQHNYQQIPKSLKKLIDSTKLLDVK